MKNFKLSLLLLTLYVAFVSCDDDDPEVIIPVELITDVEVVFTNLVNQNDVIVLSAISPNGITAPALSVNGTFTSGETYNARLTIFDTVNNENILEEVIDEKDEHFFTYDISSIDFTGMFRANFDEVRTDGERLGLDTTWTAGSSGTGTITVRLVHEPTSVDDQNGEQFEFGITEGGEFDINNTWSVSIQ